MTDTTCPTCGSAVRVVSADEGTSHYEPIETPTLDALREAIEVLPPEYDPDHSDHEWCDEDSGGNHRFDRAWWASDLAAALRAALAGDSR